MATIPEALAIAVEHYQAGRLPAAEQIARRVLQADPNQVDAIQLLGVIAFQVGQHALAAEFYERSIALRGDVAFFHDNLAAAYLLLGRAPEALACYRRALEIKPDSAAIHFHFANALAEQGLMEQAAASYRRVLELDPNHEAAHFNLGNALRAQSQLEEAAASYRRALALNPALAAIYNNLGATLKDLTQLDEAVACYRRALDLEPGNAMAWNNLGLALKVQGQREESVDCLRRAVELEPSASTWSNLGAALQVMGKLDEAVACYRRALELKPDDVAALNNLGLTLKDQGQSEAALACFRRALEWEPGNSGVASNILYTMIFCPGYDARQIGEEHRRWNRAFAEPLANDTPHTNEATPERRLRVGYVSPDFRDHCQALFTVPLFPLHNGAEFEIICYSDVARNDGITERLRSAVPGWRNISGLTDEQVTRMIREDGIDILVDLALHMARNRLLVFARKPAPVQITWLGYPGTTGLRAMDYRLTDPHLDPPGLFDECYAEESIRLPETFWCYGPRVSEPPCGELPARANRFITFGCLNNFCKINAAVLALWARVLRAVEHSRLLLLTGEGGHRQETLDRLAAEGIAPDRVAFVPEQPRPHYLEVYQRIDIALDSFPYNGHTTSLDAFWMGVPVITLVGGTVVGRAGLSQLMNLGLPELIARSEEEYVQITAALAHDLSRLAELRATLRERMRASPLMDAPRFARNLETAYRQLWRRWCARRQATWEISSG